MTRYPLITVLSVVLGSASLQAEAFKLSDARDLFDQAAEQLKTVEPIECTKALAELASIWLVEKDCLDTFDTLTDYLGEFDLPSIAYDEDGDSLSEKFKFDSGVPGPFPEVDLEGICATGKCISNLAEVHATLDQSCKPEALQKLPPMAAEAIKITRGFVDSVCKENADGKYCIEETFNAIADISPFQEDILPQARDLVCAECSIEIQRDLFAVIGVDVAMHAYSLAQTYCLKDEKGDYCPTTEVLEGAAYALTPRVVWKLVFNEEELCNSSCKTEAVALLAGSDYNPEQCFEEVKDGGIFGFLFGFSGMKKDLGGVPIEEVTSALKADISLAMKTFEEYVDIDVIKGATDGAIAFAMSLNHEMKGEASPTEDDASTAIASSPFMNANMVTQNATENPTEPLQVNQRNDSDDSDDSSPGYLHSSGYGMLVSALGIALGMLNYFTI